MVTKTQVKVVAVLVELFGDKEEPSHQELILFRLAKVVTLEQMHQILLVMLLLEKREITHLHLV